MLTRDEPFHVPYYLCASPNGRASDLRSRSLSSNPSSDATASNLGQVIHTPWPRLGAFSMMKLSRSAVSHNDGERNEIEIEHVTQLSDILDDNTVTVMQIVSEDEVQKSDCSIQASVNIIEKVDALLMYIDMSLSSASLTVQHQTVKSEEVALLRSYSS